VQGLRIAFPATSLPTLTAVEAVDILFGEDGVENGPRVDLLRKRHLDENAVDLRPAFRLRTTASTSSVVEAAAISTFSECMPSASHVRTFERT